MSPSDIHLGSHVKSPQSGGAPPARASPSKTRQTLMVLLQLIGIVAMMVLLFS